jgi:pimeloyl-ACP methyl ester carboxylesterase
MKRVFRKTAKVAATIAGVIVAFVMVLTLYHQISLKTENDKIKPNGQLVNAGGNNLHIYTEGENLNAPALIFLSGAGTAAPVYDFKPLYSLLSGRYRVAVVEKFGYGYADFTGASRDIDTVLAQSREALKLAGIPPPYVLIAHSMSGLEAICWSVKYPDEITGIVGLDMATPGYYLNGNVKMPCRKTR